VRVLVDGRAVDLTNSSRREARVVDAGAGQHRVEVQLLHFPANTPGQEVVAARDYASVRACLCGPAPDDDDAPRWASTFLPPLENPYDPSQRYMHDEVLYRFGRWEGAVEDGYLTDWLGVRTRYAWDCIKHGGYYKFVPSRRLECEQHDRLRGDAVHPHAHAPTRIPGFLPPVDDEYPEYVDMLKSVVRSKGEHYTVVELGSSYGTWGVRAIAALRRLYPHASYHLIAVESGLHRYKQLLQHVKANNVHNHTLVHGFITAAAARAHPQHVSAGAPCPRFPPRRQPCVCVCVCVCTHTHTHTHTQTHTHTHTRTHTGNSTLLTHLKPQTLNPCLNPECCRLRGAKVSLALCRCDFLFLGVELGLKKKNIRV